MIDDFRKVFLPYCLQRLDDGSYIVLNRNYKPVGTTFERHMSYEDHPGLIRFARLTPQKAAALSWKGSADLEKIWLYNDGCIPTDSAANWAAYQKRLKLLTDTAIKGVKPKSET